MQQHKALILRSNRFLGSSLVNKGLLSSADLDAANEKFMEAIRSPDLLKNASILTSLLYDLKVLDEARLLDHIVEEYGIGLIDLNQVQLRSLPSTELDLSLCWASSTIPFDKVEETYMVATCYYLSAPVVKHWEELLNGKVLWYATSMASMSRGLERLEDVLAAEKAAAEAADEE
ncbi:MAG: hypothetical protein ABS34_05615 [Opitutaceae bacterium BACL24 MAG-120322-bin51]|jgi:hypothetical protein|nr:MAG: hypothetical protein ABS34_05615 [Opitutaceae bacterium BACL24 MAG-120322-bin51]